MTKTVRREEIGTSIVPARCEPQIRVKYSMRFSSSTAKASPAPIPCARSRWAKRLDSASISPKVICLPDPVMMTAG